MSNPAVITFVTAPGIPTSECLVLEAHVRESVLDPAYNIILNYDAQIEEVVIPEGSKILIVAPGVPVIEVRSLRERWEKARNATEPQDKVVAVNYEVRIDVMSPDAPDCKSYGSYETFYPIDIE
jgi:hypothetical protein